MPKKIIKNINLQQAKFWWGQLSNKFCRLLSWKEICQPEGHGGTGIHDLTNMNLAPLTKLAWRVASEPHALISKLLYAKYGKFTGWWAPSTLKTSSSSPLKKGIMTGFNYLKGNSFWKLGRQWA